MTNKEDLFHTKNTLKNPCPSFSKILLVIILPVLASFIFASPASATSSWQKYSNNPILNAEATGNRNLQHVLNPSILKMNNSYDLWYDGNDGSGWKIGYIHSINGVNNWVDNTYPAIQTGSTDGWESETADPRVYFMPSGTYEMFYTSINSSHWSYGSDRFRTRRATSTDGLSWVRSGNWILRGTNDSWDSGGTARGRSIIYKDETYHLWYAGTNNNDLGNNPYWRIGYATSPDGINWTKQNNSNPVIMPTTSWELNNVSYPNVIYENGVYKMWYAAGNGDLPTQIVYAYSTDGINWTKPASQNPVLTRGSSGFDSQYIASPFVLHDGNIYKMWYSGFDGSRWSIGYATKNADLDIPLLKQTSDPWQSQTYDTANLWSPLSPTINTWGCALTSAVMVLNYHNINKLTDGTGLDPGTLNTWLEGQADGYIGNGLLNWLAISRLSKLAKSQNPSFSQEALEYRRIDSADKAILNLDLDNNQPDILEEPGHFVVAKGTNGDTFDINDPYYNRLTLNDGYGNTFLSLGRYIPSNTNLSYIMLSLDPNVDFSIASPGATITTVEDFIQQGIINPTTNISSAPTRILLFPTPDDDTYTISVSTTSASQNFSLKTYEYTATGSATIFNLSGYTRNDEPATFSFDYLQNPTTAPEEPSDTTPPQILSAQTLDSDGNGKLDTIEVTFIKDINGSTVNSSGSDFGIEGYKLKAKGTKEISPGVVDILLNEDNQNDTGQTPLVTLLSGAISSLPSKGGKYNLHQQTIIPADAASPTTPTADVSGGNYLDPQTITLSSFDNPNTPDIYYTLDGTEPATSSSKLTYQTPLTIDDDATLKAIAIDKAGNKSNTISQNYEIAPTIDTSSITETISSTNISFTVGWTTGQKAFGRVIFGEDHNGNITHSPNDKAGGKFGYKNTTNEEANKSETHSVTISSLNPGTTYYYRIVSRGSPEQISDERSITLPETPSTASSNSSSLSTSSSNSSGSVSAPVCNDQKPKTAPTVLYAFAGINTVTLEWKEAGDPISYYLVAYGLEPGKPLYGNPNIGGKGTTSFVVQNLSGGKTYYFRVRAGNGCTPGDFSNEVSVTPIGFAEEGLATGFTKGVLGTSTVKKSSLASSPIPTTTKTQSLVLSKNKEGFIKIGIIILSLGFITGFYLKRFL